MSHASSEEQKNEASYESNGAESEEEEERTATPDRSDPVPPEGQEGPGSSEAGAAGDAGKPSAPDWLIDNIAELSKNTRSIYLIYLGFLAYCAVTVVGTSDQQILLGESVRLPIVGVDVGLTGFFVMAPVVAICTFVYLQLYLQELEALKHTLRADYKPVGAGRLYPWMINVTDRPQPGTVGWLQRAAVKGALWWMLPVVLFLFAVWYLKAQDLSIAGWVVVLTPAAGVVAALYFWHQYHGDGGAFQDDVRSDLGKRFMLIGGGLLQLIVLLVFVSTATGWWPRFGFGIATIDVSYQSLVTEKERARYWIDLNSERLNGANFTQSILINADMQETHLKEAELSGSHLDSADLSNARLQEADLTEARLQGAVLTEARLDSAYLRRARLKGADLSGARLQGANLSGARLQGADLTEARLQGADLSGARLQGADLFEARLDSTFLPGARLQGAVLTEARLVNADLPRAFLQGTVLTEARLQRADLREARLDSAYLSGARLREALLASSSSTDTSLVQLQGARLGGSVLDRLFCGTSEGYAEEYTLCTQTQEMSSLIVDELCQATSLEEVATDPEILDGIKRKCPKLLMSGTVGD